MDYVSAAQKHLGKVVHARDGSSYERMVATWDEKDGPIPSQATLDPIRARLDAEVDTQRKIVQYEREVTPRRIREAILGVDGGWLATKDAEIATERSKL